MAFITCNKLTIVNSLFITRLISTALDDIFYRKVVKHVLKHVLLQTDFLGRSVRTDRTRKLRLFATTEPLVLSQVLLIRVHPVALSALIPLPCVYFQHLVLANWNENIFC